MERGDDEYCFRNSPFFSESAGGGAAGAAAAAAHETKWEYSAIRPEEDEEEDDDDHCKSTTTTHSCVLCANGNDDTNKDIEKVQLMLTNYYGTMSDDKLITCVAEVQHKLRTGEPADVPVDKAILDRYKRDIAKHQKHHTLEPTVILAENIRALQATARFMQGRLKMVNPETGEEKPDLRNIDMYMKIVKQITDLQGKKPDQMVFAKRRRI